MGAIAAAGLEAWHRVVRNMSPEALDEILAEDVVFHSPVVHTPQEGRALTKLYLMAAFNVFPGQTELSAEGSSPAEGSLLAEDSLLAEGSSSAEGSSDSKGNFEYVREVVGENDLVLEFKSVIDGVTINGVDMIRFDDDGKIIDFKVMVRPLKAIQKIHGQMAAMLETLSKNA